MSKPILCVDFDGVLHSYESGFTTSDEVRDGPVPGAMEWLSDCFSHFDIYIYSSRSHSQGGIKAMQDALHRWARQAGVDPTVVNMLKFPTQKPPAFLTIDDRAIQFQGDFGRLDPNQLRKFKPWNKE